MGRNCRFWTVLALGCMVAASTTTGASDAAPAKTGDTVASSVGHTWKMEEKEFVSLAEAMPEDKYDFAPTGGEFKGVRTFAQQVAHVATVRQDLAAIKRRLDNTLVKVSEAGRVRSAERASKHARDTASTKSKT